MEQLLDIIIVVYRQPRRGHLSRESLKNTEYSTSLVIVLFFGNLSAVYSAVQYNRYTEMKALRGGLRRL